MNATCKDCKERYVGCHDKCEEYQRFKKLNEEEKLKARLESEARYYACTTIEKTKAKIRKCKKKYKIFRG